MKTHTLSLDNNQNVKIGNMLIDIRNNYTISSMDIDKNFNIKLNKIKDGIDDNLDIITLSFIEISELEIDFESFSSLENGKLHFDELLVVPLEYVNIKFAYKRKAVSFKKN